MSNAITSTIIPLVVEYLRTHSLHELEQEHGVYARVSGHKMSLNYDQIEARDSDLLAQECRGLILASPDGVSKLPDPKHPTEKNMVVGALRVLAWPMNRFFNFGQAACAPVDFSEPSTRVFEKLDGTLCIVYFDASMGSTSEERWCVATRSVANADLPLDGFSGHTFSSLFKKTFAAVTGKSLSEAMETEAAYTRNLTFCFELMTPYNTVVVQHAEPSLALLAVRDVRTGGEFDPDHLWKAATFLNVPTAPSYALDSAEAAVAFVNARTSAEGKGVENEGIVAAQYLRGGKVLRCKVKSAAYVMASKNKETFSASPRNVMELILLEQIDDLLPILTAEQVASAEKMRTDLRAFLHHFTMKWNEIDQEVKDLGPLSDHNARKEFARAVGRADLWMSPAMAIFQGKTESIHSWIFAHKDRTNDKKFPSGLLDTLCKLVESHAAKNA